MSFRRTARALLITAACSALANTAAAADAVNWRSSFNTAKLEANQSGKLVLIHFYSDSCGPCRMLDRDVFSQPQIGAALEQNYVPVKINVGNSPALASAYRIDRVPAEVVLTPQGNVVAKLSCPPTPDAYGAQVANVAQHFRQQTAGQGAPIQPPVQAAYAGLKVGGYGNVQPASAPAEPKRPAPPVGPAMTTNPYVPPRPPADNRYATQQAPSQAPAVPANAMPNSYRDRYAAAAQTQPAASAPAPAAPTSPPLAAATTPPPPTVTGNIPQAGPPELPPGCPPLAFEGYCPVTLKMARKWIPGNLKFGAIHRGRTFLFVGKEQQQQFLANPDAYCPVFAGKDAVKMLDENLSVEGSRRFGFEYGGAFYLFATAETRDRFEANPDRYAAGVRQAMNRLESAGTIRR